MSVIPLNATQYYFLFDLCIICNYVVFKTNVHFWSKIFSHQDAHVGSGSRPVASRMYTEGSFTGLNWPEREADH